MDADRHRSENICTCSGHKTRNLDPLGGGHLIRQVRQTQKLVPYRLPNIYKSDLNNYAVKRNFDEIDQTSLPLSKRFFSAPAYRYQNDMPIEMSWRSGFDKKRLSPLADYPMDEIDVSNFPIGSKRSLGNSLNSIERYYSSARGRRGGDWPMDEIDASYFPVGSRRSVSR